MNCDHPFICGLRSHMRAVTMRIIIEVHLATGVCKRPSGKPAPRCGEWQQPPVKEGWRSTGNEWLTVQELKPMRFCATEKA